MSAFLGPIHFMMYNKIQRQNNLLDDVIFYSELQKLNHNDNLSKGYNRKYITRFCAVSKKEFKYLTT